MPEKLKKKIFVYIKIIIAVAIIYFLVKNIRLQNLMSALSSVNYYYLLIVALLGVLNIYLQYFKWKEICNKNLGENSFSKIIRSLFSGFAAGLITPARAGEYWGRYSELSPGEPVKVTYSVLIDKLSLLAVEMTLGAIPALIFAISFLRSTVLVYVVAVLILLCFSMLAFSFAGGNIQIEMFVKKITGRYRIINSIYEKYTSIRLGNNKLKAEILFVSFLQYLCFCLQLILLICGFGKNVNFAELALAVGFVFYARNFLSFLTPGEIGTREGITVFAFSYLKIDSAVAFNTAFIVFVINVVIPSVIGALLYLKGSDD